MFSRRALLPAVASLLFVADAAAAQETVRPKNLGVYYGRTWSDYTSIGISSVLLQATAIEKEGLSGGQFGFYLTLPVGGRFAIQPEAFYIRKGATFALSGDGGFPDQEPEPIIPGTTFGLQVAYLELPVLARLDLRSPDNPNRPFIVAGPAFALRASCQYGLSMSNTKVQVQCNESGVTSVDPANTTDHIRKYDVGVIVGGGVAFRFFGLPSSLQGRYGRGLTSVSRNNPDIDTRNTTMSLLFGAGF